jgi:hypothetical protein
VVGLLAGGVDAWASESDAVVAGFKVLSYVVDEHCLGPVENCREGAAALLVSQLPEGVKKTGKENCEAMEGRDFHPYTRLLPVP